MAILRHDPRRPLLLAVNAARVLGVLNLVIGSLYVLLAVAVGYRRAIMMFPLVFGAFFAVVGILYWLFAAAM